MATRATLSVFDGENKFDIYRHHDGYPNGPHGIIHDIHLAKRLAWEAPHFEAGDFAASLVATMKKSPGSVYLTRQADQHLDRSFHYDITYRNECIEIAIHSYSERIGKVIPSWNGSLEAAILRYDAVPDRLDEQPDDPWAALAIAEMALADIKAAQAKGYLTEARAMIFAVMDAKRRRGLG